MHKELKETLRDRRTIITLVLMPLLVYPLLSLALRQFLLSGSQTAHQVQWTIGAATEAELRTLSQMLRQGEQAIVAESTDPPSEAIGTVVVPVELTEAVRDHRVDLGVRIKRHGESGSTDNLPTADVELIHRPGAPISAAVLDYVERRLRALNDQYVTSRLRELGDDQGLPASWKLRPVIVEDVRTGTLATLVPLMLILMTITGAVYPAIDLTAGERERGTLEALMAAPVPRLGLLFAKYVAVVTVALLTAIVNLMAMTITVAASGLGPQLFGEQGLTVGGVTAVFVLLVLFAAFFSAVLLCLTSFARSFKEAQAYLIPLMLMSLGPGFLSLIPGVHLGPVLAITPLANIVLLARDVLAGNASPLWGAIAVLTTTLYGALALALAARIFGSDAILFGSQGSWSDLFRRPQQPLPQATPAGALGTLAVLAPLYVVLSSSLVLLHGSGMALQLVIGAIVLLALFGALPLWAARWQGVAMISGFQLRRPSALALFGAVVLGLSLAPLAYELILLSQDFGFATISGAQLEEKQPAVEALLIQWRALSPAIVLIALAVVPAIAEELFFRGYLLGSLRGRLPASGAILLTGLVFGLFHANVGGIVAVERVLSSACLGIVLGWVCWTSRSVFPGMVLHAINNGLLISLAYWGDGLKAIGLGAVGQRHLPLLWLAAAAVLSALGLTLVWWGKRQTTFNSPADLTIATPPATR
jgi:ABC-2 type transport system permease protein/sodium transport system permease protein